MGNLFRRTAKPNQELTGAVGTGDEKQSRVKPGEDVKGTDGTTALMAAVFKGHTEIVKELIGAGAEVNKQGNKGWTALMIGAQEGHTEIVNELVGAGAELNKQHNSGTTALMRAAQEGHTEIVNELVGAGAELNKQDNDGVTALMRAAQAGHTEIVKELIGAGAELNKQNNDGCTALMVAAQKGHTEIVKELVGAGAEVNKQDNDGDTALMAAAPEGHTEMVNELVGAGAEVNKQNNYGQTALMRAVIQSDSEAVKLFCVASSDMKSHGQSSMKQCNLNLANRDGETALFLATKLGHEAFRTRQESMDSDEKCAVTSVSPQYKIVYQLLKFGASIKGQRNPCTAHIDLGIQNDPDILSLLFAAGGEITQPDMPQVFLKEIQSLELQCLSRRTIRQQLLQSNPYSNLYYLVTQLAIPNYLQSFLLFFIRLEESQDLLDSTEQSLIEAARTGDLMMLTSLTEEGADVNRANEQGNTALMMASYEGNLDCIQFLLESGSEVNWQNHQMNTPLHLATQSEPGNHQCVSALLAAGAHVNSRNQEGKTPLMLIPSQKVSQHGRDIVKLLLASGPDVDIQDHKGHTAVTHAISKHNSNVLTELLKAGASPNLCHPSGISPLVYATIKGFVDCIKILITSGADVNLKIQFGTMAALNTSFECLQLLVHSGAKFDVSVMARIVVIHKEFPVITDAIAFESLLRITEVATDYGEFVSEFPSF